MLPGAALLMEALVVLCQADCNGASSTAAPPDDDAAAPTASNPASCSEELELVGLDDPTSFGHTPRDVARMFDATPAATLEWGASAQPFPWLVVRSPTGTTQLTSRLERIDRAFLVHRTEKPDNGPFRGANPALCGDGMNLEGTLRFATADGAFDEHWPVTLEVAFPPQLEPTARYEVDLGTMSTEVQGSFAFMWQPVEPGATLRVFVAGSLGRPAGEVSASKLPGPASNMGGVAILAAWGNHVVVTTRQDAGPTEGSDAGAD
jgi:hypothetical protein